MPEETKWTDLTQKIQDKQLSSKTWKSEQASLITIFSAAEQMGLEPKDASLSSTCNLRTIIKDAKFAVYHNNPERLSELFHLASSLTVRDLRLKLGSVKLDEVIITPQIVDGQEKYLLSLTPELLNRIARPTKIIVKFTQEGSNAAQQ